MLRFKRFAALPLVALLAVAACDDDDDGPTQPPQPRTINFNAVGTSGVTGTATITNTTGTNSTVQISVTGPNTTFTANSSHLVQVHNGTCTSIGTLAATVGNATVGSTPGTATLPATNVPDAALTTGNHAIVVYQGTGTTTRLACANV